MSIHLENDFKCASTESLIEFLKELDEESIKEACIEQAKDAWNSDYTVLSDIGTRACRIMFAKHKEKINEDSTNDMEVAEV